MECPQKKVLAAMKLQEGAQGGKKGSEDGSKEDEPQPRISAIRFLESHE